MLDDQYIALFAKRMTELRMNKGFTARDMSLSIGLSHNYIHNIEAKKNYPNMYNFFIICDYLEITPKDYFDYTDTTPSPDKELYETIRKLDADTQADFLRLFNSFMSRRPSI